MMHGHMNVRIFCDSLLHSFIELLSNEYNLQSEILMIILRMMEDALTDAICMP